MTDITTIYRVVAWM